MRVIIAGGSGLLGRHLTQQLSKKNYDVIILSRSPEKSGDWPANVCATKWDGKTAEGWGELINGAAAVINLAGASIGDKRWSQERKRLIINSRIQTTQAIVAAIRNADEKPKVLVQGSAVGYYGGNRGDEILTESASAGNDFLAEVTEKWESALGSIDEELRVVKIRTGVVLTTKGGPLPRMLPLFKLFAGGPFGNGKQWFPWIHIEDEVKAIIHLMENESANGAYNLAAPDIIQNKAFAKALGTVLSRPSLASAPAFALKAVLGEMSALLLDGQRADSQRLIESGYTFSYPHLLPALKDIVYNEK